MRHKKKLKSQGNFIFKSKIYLFKDIYNKTQKENLYRVSKLIYLKLFSEIKTFKYFFYVSIKN